VAELAKTYPWAQWVIAHVGASFAAARGAASVMKEYPNVWAELTYTSVTNGLIEWLVSQVGDDRILFGSDAPMRDPRPQLGWVIWSDLPIRSRRRILGENYLQLLKKRRTP
jgi:predicted TIM-barrel fold metal-dependent hydrolase